MRLHSLSAIILGLKDDYDIKMLAHLILVKFARAHTFTGALHSHSSSFAGQQATDWCSLAVLGSIPPIVEPMEKTLKTKPKSSATQNEIDRNDDMIRGCMRAIEKLLKIEGADCEPRLGWPQWCLLALSAWGCGQRARRCKTL